MSAAETRENIDTFLQLMEIQFGKTSVKKAKNDFQQFAAYIVSADGSVNDSEVNFMNQAFGTTYKARDLANYISANDIHSKRFAEAVPVAFKLVLDNVETAVLYLQLCGSIGKEVLMSDEKADQAEAECYNSYIQMLCDALEKKYPNYSLEFEKILPTKTHDVTSDDKDVADGESNDAVTLEDLLNELECLIGLSSVKRNVHSLIHLQEIQRERAKRGLPQIAMSNHLVFTGNPGTGKTTIARLIGRIYHKIGLLKTDRFVEVDRSGMVAGYVGQTAIEVKNVVDSAMGGVLFIDEAYSLANGLPGDYGTEAIETLLKRMEDNRQDIVVIVAGYPKLMEQFINSNPGLRSRFSKKIHFPDYTPDELVEILNYMCEKHKFTISDDAVDYALSYFERLYENRGDDFANAREVRNLFEAAIVSQADRLYGKKELSDEELCRLEKEDFFYNGLMIEGEP